MSIHIGPQSHPYFIAPNDGAQNNKSVQPESAAKSEQTPQSPGVPAGGKATQIALLAKVSGRASEKAEQANFAATDFYFGSPEKKKHIAQILSDASMAKTVVGFGGLTLKEEVRLFPDFMAPGLRADAAPAA